MISEDCANIITESTKSEFEGSLGRYLIEIQQLIDVDVFGAWRAGYDFLHVYSEQPMAIDEPGFHLKTQPSYTPFPPKVLGDSWMLSSSYDLRKLTIKEVRDARQK